MKPTAIFLSIASHPKGVNDMSGDDEDDYVEDPDTSLYEDIVSQRCAAFVNLGNLAERAKNPIVKELTYSMMKKLCLSLKMPSTAEVTVFSNETQKEASS